MNARSAARRCIMEADAATALRLWPEIFPQYPPLGTEADALVVLHTARTAMQTIPPRQRFWSHRWLRERGLPSRLPDNLRPRAERMYPKIAEGVLIAINTKYPAVRVAIQRATSDAIMDCYANGDTEPAFVKARWQDARMRERRGLML